MSLKDNLLKLIKERGQISYGAMCQFTVEEGYKIGTAERRLRELVHEQPIVPITAISKRNTEYISGWKMEEPAYVMKGNERDCICAKINGEHEKHCDAYRFREFSLKVAAIMISGKSIPIFAAPKKIKESQKVVETQSSLGL